MAQLDYINIRGIDIALGVNLSQTVGIAAPNLPQDVAAVQAFFRIIAKGMGREKIGLDPTLPLPKVTGVWDAWTHLAILKYQSHFRHRLLTGKKIDTLFHPASYQGRLIKHPRKPLMAITLLHIHAKYGDWTYPAGYDYVENLKDRIAPWGPLPMPQYSRPSLSTLLRGS